jgi:hypothetical protein
VTKRGDSNGKGQADLPQVRYFCIVGLVLDAVDGAWYDYDDPNQVTPSYDRGRAN